MTYLGKSILAVVPARGGSKSIPKKNLKKICGRSLISYAGEICNSLDWIDLAIISTDDDEIAKEGIKSGLEMPFIRPKDLAKDDSNSIDMWRHAWIECERIYKKTFDISILLEPTSPLRIKEEVEECVNNLIKNNYPGIVTISLTPAHFRPHKTLLVNSDGKIGFFLPPKKEYSLRQNIPPYYYRNGICYAITRKKLIDENIILDESISTLIINRPVINIDEPFDLELAEILLKKNINY